MNKKIKTIFLGNNLPQFEILSETTNVVALFTRFNQSTQLLEDIVKLAKKKQIPIFSPKTMKLEKDEFAYKK